MINSRDPMHHTIFDHQLLHNLIKKMCAFVTNDRVWSSKMVENLWLQIHYNNFRIISMSSVSIHSFWDIINNKQDIDITKRWGEGAIHSKPQTSNISQELGSRAYDFYGLYYLFSGTVHKICRTREHHEKCRPVETTLEYLVGCSFRVEESPQA